MDCFVGHVSFSLLALDSDGLNWAFVTGAACEAGWHQAVFSVRRLMAHMMLWVTA
jgi:hypothetical protein